MSQHIDPTPKQTSIESLNDSINTFTLLADMTAIDTSYTLSDAVTNYKYLVATSYFQGNAKFYLATLIIPIIKWSAGNSFIVCFNDGTIRKGQFTASGTTVHTGGTTSSWTNITGIELYGVK